MKKRVLIAGAGSYIGISFENWIKANCSEISVDTVDLECGEWHLADFTGYDTVFHVAGIAHVKSGKITEQQEGLYDRVNAKLPLQCAQKAKEQGVSQYIFMSSIIVYGDSGSVGREKVITKDTLPSPTNCYGVSKLKAEEGLLKLQDEDFKVVILRCPMVYGKGSKGNYRSLAEMARKLPVFPLESNKRSMIYIENLCKFVELMIKNEEQGIFYPQNGEYVQTSRMVAAIAGCHGKKIWLTGLLHPVLWLLSRTGGKPGRMVNKAFGNLFYEQEMSVYKEPYQLFDLEESVKRTEK